MEIHWFMLVTLFTRTTWSAVVTVTPENIVVEAGIDSVNFTCIIELKMMEATSEHWIMWWKDYIERIVDNDTVVVNPDKYTVYGSSSPDRTHYTQTLQIHDIDEEDNGTYTCNLQLGPYISSSLPESTGRLLIYLEIPQPTSYKDISYTPSTSKLSDITNNSDDQTETPPADFTTSTRLPTSESSDKKINPIVIFVGLAGTVFVVFLIIVIIIVGKRKNKTKNEENDFNSCQNGHWLNTDNSRNGREITEEETVIDNEIDDNQLHNIQDDDFDQQLEYKNSVFKTDTDDLDPSCAAVNQTNAEEDERQDAKDDSFKSSNPLEDYSHQVENPTNKEEQEDHLTELECDRNKLDLDADSEYMSTEDLELKRVSPVTTKKTNKSTKQKVINYPAKNGDLYAQVDKSSKSINKEHLGGSRVEEGN